MAWDSAQKGRNHGKYGSQKRRDFPQNGQFPQGFDSPVRVDCSIRNLEQVSSLRRGMHGILHGTPTRQTRIHFPQIPASSGTSGGHAPAMATIAGGKYLSALCGPRVMTAAYGCSGGRV
jgi:hypothetical protein